MLNADPVLALLSRALDAAALRQSVHATNIANVDTEGYRRLEVVYSAELQRLNAEGPALDTEQALQWSQVEPEVVESAETRVRLGHRDGADGGERRALPGLVRRHRSNPGNTALCRTRRQGGLTWACSESSISVRRAWTCSRHAWKPPPATSPMRAPPVRTARLYKPLTVVVRSAIAQEMGAAGTPIDTANLPLPTAEVVTQDVAPKLVYDPGHPDADERGMVSLPGVDPVSSMLDLISISRGYEANLRAFDITRSLLQRTLDLGKNR